MEIDNGLYTIYVLTNKVNQRMYIGTTSKTLKTRFHRGEGYRHQKNIYSDICKFGWDNFEHDVFAAGLTEQEAFNMEKLLIEKTNELYPGLLYNRDSGGKYGKHCDTTKEIIRAINKNKIVSDKTKDKIKQARAKQIFSEETIQKRTEKMKGQKRSEEFCKKLGERSSKPVLCIETGFVYKSATAAAKDLSLSVSGVSQNCNGKMDNVKGYHFRYV